MKCFSISFMKIVFPRFLEVLMEIVEPVAYTAYESELLTVLGSIQGYLLFFVVVLLCFFAYKFFRMFF